MADTTGLFYFGGGYADYARADDTLELLPDTPLILTNPTTGAPVTGLLDSTATATAAVSTDSTGAFAFWAPLPVLSMAVAGGRTYTVAATGALVSAAGIGNAADLIAAANAAAVAAAASAGAAAASAAGKISETEKGAPGGVATLDDGDSDPTNVGRVPMAQAPQALVDFYNVNDGGQVAAPNGPFPASWNFYLSDPFGKNSLVAGKVGEAVWCPYDLLLEFGPRLMMDNAGTADFVVTIEMDTGTGYADLYGTTHPTITAGDAFNSATVAPSTTYIPAGALWRPRLIAVPPVGVPSVTAATAGVVKSGGTGAGTGSYTIPMPQTSDGASTADMCYAVVWNGGNASMSLPSPWHQETDQQTATPLIRAKVYSAQWSPTLAAAAVPVTSGSTGQGFIILMHNVDQTAPAPQILIGDNAGNGSGENLGGTSVKSPTAVAADADYDLILYLVGADTKNVGATGYSFASVSGLTKIGELDEVFAAHSTLQISAWTHAAVAQAASIPQELFTLSGGTGTLAADAWEILALGIPRAQATPGPSEAGVRCVARAGAPS